MTSDNGYGSPQAYGKARKPSRWLRKTKLCVYHLQNDCSLGSSCLFAHSLNELQDGPDLYKTQMCNDFMNGRCDNDDCTFAHGQEELQAFPTLKQKLCKWHRKGKCRNGYSCSFAHGQQDLQTGVNAGGSEAEASDDLAVVPPPPLPPTVASGSPAPAVMMAAMQTQVQPAIMQVMPYLSLQAALPEASAVPDYLPMQQVIYCWNAPAPTPAPTPLAKRTPLNSRVRPFVPMAAALTAHVMVAATPAPPGENSVPDEGKFRDDLSTSAETAGYLSD